jgi:nucleotide-binding universal stress UspA family protein
VLERNSPDALSRQGNGLLERGSLTSQFELSKILVAVDDSENAKRALEVAVRLSREYQSKLIILNAVLIDKYGIQHSKYTEEASQRIVNKALSVAREGFAEGYPRIR